MKKRWLSFMGICSMIFMGKLFINSTEKDDSRTSETKPENDINVDKAGNADLKFAGQHVPLEDPVVKYRLTRELKANWYWHPIAAELAQKAARFFPIIRPILKKNGIPDDFKYLPLIESGFTNMVSKSGAAGPWQIMPSTGRVYGLAVNSQIDERYHIIKSTEAACKILKDAYRSLKDWTLVAASFNKGLGGIENAMKSQHVHSYYKLRLNPQAQNYVFRVLAVKEIMEHPVKYGFKRNVAHFYYSIPTIRIRISGSIANLKAFARNNGVSLKTLKTYNPWLRANRFDNPESKTFYVEIPRDKEVFPVEQSDMPAQADNTKVNSQPVDSAENFISNNITTLNVYNDVAPEVTKYTVKDGEDINFVARKFNVKPSKILEWNHLENARIHKGDVLKIRFEENLENTPSK